MLNLLFLALALMPTRAVLANAVLDEAAAVRAIERAGGQITRDNALPGHPVTAVAFWSGTNITEKEIELLRPFDRLTSLSIDLHDSANITPGGLREIGNLKNLTRFHVWNSAFARIGDDGLKEIEKLEHLTRFGLSRNKTPGPGLRFVCYHRQLTSM